MTDNMKTRINHPSFLGATAGISFVLGLILMYASGGRGMIYATSLVLWAACVGALMALIIVVITREK